MLFLVVVGGGQVLKFGERVKPEFDCRTMFTHLFSLGGDISAKKTDEISKKRNVLRKFEL